MNLVSMATKKEAMYESAIATFTTDASIPDDRINFAKGLFEYSSSLTLEQFKEDLKYIAIATNDPANIPHKPNGYDTGCELLAARAHLRTYMETELPRSPETLTGVEQILEYSKLAREKLDAYLLANHHPSIPKDLLEEALIDEMSLFTAGALSTSNKLTASEWGNMVRDANKKPGNGITTKPNWAGAIDDNIGVRNTRATLFLYGPGGTGKSALFDYFQNKGTKIVRVSGAGNEALLGGFERTLDNAFPFLIFPPAL